MPAARPSDAARRWLAVFSASRHSSCPGALLALLHEVPHPTLDIALRGSALTPLIGACVADSPWLVAKLAALGASPDFPDLDGWTPLHWCCQSNRSACALALLEAGADPNATHPNEPSTCLHFCAQSSSTRCAALLIAHGADPDAIDPASGASPRHWGAHDAALSLAMGPHALGPDLLGRTALHWAARQAASDAPALEACLMWVHLGCDPLALDLSGDSPSDLALRRGLPDCWAYLDSLRERSGLLAEDWVRRALDAPRAGPRPRGL